MVVVAVVGVVVVVIGCGVDPTSFSDVNAKRRLRGTNTFVSCTSFFSVIVMSLRFARLMTGRDGVAS